MRAGKLAHVIEIQRASATVNDAGTPTQTWAKVATLRAELVEQTAEEFLRNAGDTTDTTLIFRTRYVAGILNTDRVSFDGEAYGIERVVTLGRNRGLELRCKAVTP